MKKVKLILLVITISIPFYLYAPPLSFNTISALEKTIETINKIELDLFLNALGNEETGDTLKNPKCWSTINRIGAKGRWQLMTIALRDIGYNGTIKHFLNSRKIQRECMIKLMKKNKYYLECYLPNYKNYIGKIVKGVKITFSGLIAASHLSGVGGVKAFLIKGYNANDGHMSTKDYLKKFNNFNIEQII